MEEYKNLKLPNGISAEISERKLIDYCLNSNHPRGRDKARVFSTALGITSKNAGKLKELIQIAALEGEVVDQKITEFGLQFKVDWIIPNTDQVTLRTLWEITNSNPNPRLISSFRGLQLNNIPINKGEW